MKKWFPWVLTLVMAAWAFSSLKPRPEHGFPSREFGRLPVLLNGRFQPFDTVARNALLQIRAKQTVPAPGGTLSAMDWLLEVMAKPEAADARAVFRIDNRDLLALLKLPEDQKHYSFNELTNGLPDLEREGARIQGVESGRRSVFEKQLMKLHNALGLYHRLKNILQYEGATEFPQEIDDYLKSIPAGMEAQTARAANKDYDHPAFDKLFGMLGRYQFMDRLGYALAIPPADPRQPGAAWVNAGLGLMEAVQTSPPRPALRHYASMMSACQRNNPAEFLRAVRDYRQWLFQSGCRAQLDKAGREFIYNDLQAFYKAIVLYVLALVLACLSWINGGPVLRRSAESLIVLGVLIHTVGIVFRMMLEGRPPVTNLYSSAVFIGWGSVLLGLGLERVYKDGIGSVAGSLMGFVTLIIAHHLSLGGDTMEMLRAVLDTNFWLATHVVTVTLGYSATFVAGLLAILYILRGALTPTLSRQSASAIGGMVYGILCFATLFSFIGTVLGGIWADQSWGRFWGWDPKENGALIIVLWNAAILHARAAGIVQDRGLMNMAVFGNIVTSFSWFGVNMLGVGLHSYGFMDAAFFWLMAFITSQLAIIGAGLIPLHLWASFRKPAPPAS